jgi:benzaldehyde dehydrogenase (NAD)
VKMKLPSGSHYGLSLDILTADVGPVRGSPIGSRRAHINDQTVKDEPHVPFGGVLVSGAGSAAASPISTHSP